ncbi:hypothetical protein P154DRAFT_539418 [Amniculicola lignicola CBS 123094]|uniref:Rhodopsin domain-containing protein n=1 Tax=Amniculicola lignicola CBS 123094 TaxID=1392246 RepID=A0A6A5W3G8_9PLEO|nr:hypothetical protein P154DRAFT_539418 [Amniculicola lignicola CBS 123094]
MSSGTIQPMIMPPGSFDDRGPGLRNLVIVIVCIMILSVVLRFWSRALVKTGVGSTSRFWWDDWLALLALPLLSTGGALLLDMIRLGMGRHTWDIPPENIVPLVKRLFALFYCYHAGLVVAKASCLLFYTRLLGSPASSTWLARGIHVTHMLNFGAWMGTVYLVTYNSNPTALTAPGYRPGTMTMWLSTAIPSVVIDLILLVLPLPTVWALNIKRSRKVAVIGIFICGYCVVVVSLGRLITIVKLRDLRDDFTYVSVPSVYWGAAEGPMTLLCVCIPSMLTLWRRVITVTKRRLSRNSSSNNSYLPNDQEITSPTEQPKFRARSAFDVEMDAFRGDGNYANNSLLDSESMILSPSAAHHSYAVNVPKPANAMFPYNESCDTGIWVQNEIDISRSTT